MIKDTPEVLKMVTKLKTRCLTFARTGYKKKFGKFFSFYRGIIFNNF